MTVKKYVLLIYEFVNMTVNEFVRDWEISGEMLNKRKWCICGEEEDNREGLHHCFRYLIYSIKIHWMIY